MVYIETGGFTECAKSVSLQFFFGTMKAEDEYWSYK